MRSQLLRAEASAPEPEAVSIDETCRLTGLGRSKVYQLIASGTLPSLKIGKRRLVRPSAIRRLIADLERAGLDEAA
jgi:excisionase family DNA binding protein